jgi:hypothetical protein
MLSCLNNGNSSWVFYGSPLNIWTIRLNTFWRAQTCCTLLFAKTSMTSMTLLYDIIGPFHGGFVNTYLEIDSWNWDTNSPRNSTVFLFYLSKQLHLFPLIDLKCFIIVSLNGKVSCLARKIKILITPHTWCWDKTTMSTLLSAFCVFYEPWSWLYQLCPIFKLWSHAPICW